MTSLPLAALILLMSAVDTTSAAGAGDIPLEDKRNVMLNAEASNRPREINLGIFADDYGTIVAEDGLLSSYIYHPMYSYHHWAGGNAYSGVALMPLAESTMAYGLLGYALDSRTRFSEDCLSAMLTAATSSDARIKFDGVFSAPAGDGLSFTFGAYVNKDPTSTHPSAKRYVNDLSVFKAAMRKKWSKGSLVASYKLSLSNDFATTSYAPFVYQGNGEVAALGDFSFGKDNYFPEDLNIDYISILDGSSRSRSLADMNGKRIHDILISYQGEIAGDWKLEAGLHPVLTGKFDQLDLYISGIDDLSKVPSHSFTFADGSPYDGFVQTRTAAYSQSRYSDLVGNVAISGNLGPHALQFGLDDMFIDRSYVLSSATFAHSAEANPVRLYRAGRSSWDYNSIGKFYEGRENVLTLHAMDEFHPCERVGLKLGVRAAWHHKNFYTASNLDGEHCNDRYDGYHLADGTARRNHFILNEIALGGVAQLDLHLVSRLYLSVGEIFIQNPCNMSSYFFTRTPADILKNSNLATGGLDWRGKNLQLTSALSYVSMNNLTCNTTTSKQIGGQSETKAYIADAALGTLGWTTDANLTWKGLGLHFLMTLQNPRFTKFEGDVSFSNGETEHCDFSGYSVVGMSHTLLEIDPSYSWKGFRLWASARYYGKQYANRINSLYFKGHWETFAGVSCSLGKHLDIALDCTNLLGQSGIKGVISGADSVEDVASLVGSTFAGRFIIPFTANLSMTLKL